MEGADDLVAGEPSTAAAELDGSMATQALCSAFAEPST